VATLTESRLRRLRLEARGAVQGVGFRPFVFRLAAELGARGWIVNDPGGVVIEIEGDLELVSRFAERLKSELPPRAAIHELHQTWLEPVGFERFEILPSGVQGRRTAVVLPDLATCDGCSREIFDPTDRRHGYPFTNCTNCGPRFSIIRALPYDRPSTTMAGFTMCPACAAEYADPLDRRFHAQPNACPECGPRLALWDVDGQPLVVSATAPGLATAARALREGLIVAVKGLGGFHLMVDARNPDAVQRLRERKHRPCKPLAVMAGTVAQARELCAVGPEEEMLLASPEAPIVLLERRPDAPIAEGVAPSNRWLGVMLACTPLHHLLLREVGFPLVATSGNLSEEPICTEEHDALERLGEIADLFLVHDRPIERHVDDSVARVLRGAPQVLRRARGYAPLPVRLPSEVPPILAVGAHLKNSVALGVARQVFVSQHIGDLDAPESQAAFERVIRDFLRLYEARPVAVAHDLHPDYASSAWAALAPGLPDDVLRIGVQHHHAHLASCLAENGVTEQALGIIWDGTGYGAVDGVGDGTVWGGEFLLGDAAAFQRYAHLHPFLLPGGEAAVREPRRVALALLWELLGEAALDRDDLVPLRSFSLRERHALGSMLRRGTNCPTTTSMGRIFDGVAALLGLCQRARFEGEAAMALEFAADLAERGAYPLPLGSDRTGQGPRTLDWRPLLTELLADLERGATAAAVAARFHNALVGAMVEIARAAGREKVALSGGCFQNRWLAERGAAALESAGFQVLLHRQVPPNDGGISLGQVAVAAAHLAQRT
jgi:hydrogenase maturation protein HypF